MELKVNTIYFQIITDIYKITLLHSYFLVICSVKIFSLHELSNTILPPQSENYKNMPNFSLQYNLIFSMTNENKNNLTAMKLNLRLSP